MQNFQELLSIARERLDEGLDQEAYNCLIDCYDQVTKLSSDPLEQSEFFSLLALSLGRLRRQLDEQIRELCRQSNELLVLVSIEKRESILKNLSRTYLAINSDQELEEIFVQLEAINVQLLAVRQFVYGTDSFEAALTHCNLGRLYLFRNESEAAKSFKNCLSITEVLVKNGSPTDLTSLIHLKSLKELCLVVPPNQEGFVELLDRIRHFYSANANVDPEPYGTFLTRLAEALDLANFHFKAELVAREAVEVCSLRHGVDSVQTRRAAYCLARVLVDLERENEADAIAVRYLGQDSNPNIPSGFYAMGFQSRLLKYNKGLPFHD